jgi:TRAP-type mannitol/chloroaromatic compound transport system permease large subunit
MQNTRLRMGTLFSAFVPFLLILLVGMVVIAIFPQMSLWIPELAENWGK